MMDAELAGIDPRDGRHKRAEVTRAAIVQACRSLMAEGQWRPSMRACCIEAKRSTRAAFQGFKTLDALYAEALRDENTMKAIARQVLQDDGEFNAMYPLILERIARAAVFGKAEA